LYQEVEYLLCKHEALSSILSVVKKKEKGEEKEEEEEKEKEKEEETEGEGNKKGRKG
jgi:hypothetical protein